MGSGVRQGLNYSEFSKLKVPMPLLSEQQAIADYLDETCSKIDEIIAEAKASIDEYKELKQSVIFEAVTKGLDKNIEMKDSGVEWIGEIPNDAKLVPLKYLVSKTIVFISGNNRSKFRRDKHGVHQHLMLNSRSTSRIFSKVVIRVGTNGRRSLFSMKPIAFSILFAPAGLPSTNSNSNNSVKR